MQCSITAMLSRHMPSVSAITHEVNVCSGILAHGCLLVKSVCEIQTPRLCEI